MKKKSRVKRYILLVCALVLVVGAVIFFQFTAIGYRMTVPVRSFDAILPHTYVEKAYAGDREEAIQIVEEARARVEAFWGSLESAPVIISDRQATIGKLGGDHDTNNVLIFGPRSYISVSEEYLNVDIMAHEMTHAELFARLYRGKVLPKTLVPTWFDEGVATQNDYREQYSEAVWAEQTNHGENVIPLDEMDTFAEFYAGEAEDRRFRYLVSKHEVRQWLEENGKEALLELVEQVNEGEDFAALYHR